MRFEILKLLSNFTVVLNIFMMNTGYYFDLFW